MSEYSLTVNNVCARARPFLRRRSAGRSPSEQTTMTSKTAPSFKTIPNGTAVTWHYRSAIGHGTVTGVHKPGTTADNTMYAIAEHDHHPGSRTWCSIRAKH